jgi:recombination associated protein RdgC
MENILDMSFRKSHYMLGDYLLLTFRIDRRAIPLSLMKIRLMEEKERLAKKTKAKKNSRDQKEAIQNAVYVELIENDSAVTAIHEVC